MIDCEIVPMETWWHLEHSIQLARSCFKHDLKAIASLRDEILDHNAFYWVILVNGGVKGFGGIKKTGIHSQVYECPWRVINPEYRGHGIGNRLMQVRLDEIKRRGGQFVLLSTPNPQLCEKFGFKLIATLKDTWAPYVMMLKMDE